MMAAYLNTKGNQPCAILDNKDACCMGIFNVTFKRIEAFYQAITVPALTAEEARNKADALFSEAAIEFNYFKETDLIDEYILNVEIIA